MPEPAPTLLLMAAGMGSRYGGLKQVAPMGPSGESLVDYAVYDAKRAGFGRVVFVIRRDIETDFRETVLARLGAGGVEVEYVFQDLADLPAGAADVDVSHRSKPWGTAHAVWSARDAVREPFVVLNADDYYGPSAYRLLAEHLARGTGEYAILGYRLGPTLSEHGTVARGILEQDGEGRLLRIRERTQIARGDDGVIRDADPGARPDRPEPVGGKFAERSKAATLPEDSDVSMNIMAFAPRVFGQLEGALVRFLRKHAGRAKSELYLPNVVGELVARGEATVRVPKTDDEWFGVTYAADAERVRSRLRALTAEGVYPEALWLRRG